MKTKGCKLDEKCQYSCETHQADGRSGQYLVDFILITVEKGLYTPFSFVSRRCPATDWANFIEIVTTTDIDLFFHVTLPRLVVFSESVTGVGTHRVSTVKKK